MKLSLVFLAVLGVATAASIPSTKVATKNLEDDLNDFLALVPGDELLAVIIKYLSEDEEVQTLLLYLLGDEFKALVVEVQTIPEYIAFLDYTQKAGLDIYKWVNMINELLGLETLPVPTRSVSTRTGGVAGLVDEILALLPRDEIRALFEEKIETSADFAQFVAYLASDEFQTVVKALQDNSEYQKIIATLESKGVPVAAIIELGNSLIGLA